MKTEKSIILAGVQRSGTSLLCEAMKQAGSAGVPEEYLLTFSDREWAERPARAVRAHVEKVLDMGTTPNGLFAVNIMWNYYAKVAEVLARLPECAQAPPHAVWARVFPDPHYIWIRRRDRVRQAVSWAKAVQTGIYASYEIGQRVPKQKPRFDFTFIDNLNRLVREGEVGWQTHFKKCGAKFVEVFYEDLVADLDGTLGQLLPQFGLAKSVKLGIEKLPVKKQADAINEEWIRRYHEMKEAQQDAGETTWVPVPSTAPEGSQC